MKYWRVQPFELVVFEQPSAENQESKLDTREWNHGISMVSSKPRFSNKICWRMDVIQGYTNAALRAGLGHACLKPS